MALLLDPLNEEIADWGIWALTMTNQLDEAIVWGEEKIRLHPNNPYPMLGVSIAYYLHGDVEKSLLWANKGVELSQRAPLALVILAQVYAVSGESLKALNLIDEANAQGAYTCPYETAVVHGMLGNDNAMFEQLNLAIDYQSNCLIFTKH